MKNLILMGVFFLNFINLNQAFALEVTTLTSQIQASGGLSVAENGDIYVADYGVALNNANGRNVYKIDPLTGDSSVFATGFSGASGNVIGSDGLLYQSSILSHRVTRVEANGQLTTLATTADGLSSPVGLAFNSQGDLFINNCGNSSISKIASNGTVSLFISSTLLNCPNGLTVDNEDNLYAVNFSNGNIIKVSADGIASIFASTPSSVNKPSGGNGHIVFANNGLYLVSNATHQVFSLSLDGQLQVIAGTGVQAHDDGEVMLASFSLPNGIGINPEGTKLYVNDSTTIGTANQISPNVVRVIELTGSDGVETITPNNGLTGAWYEPSTSGQGFLIDVNTENDLFFSG